VAEDINYFESEDFKEILRQYEESVKSGERIYMDADDLTDIADYYQYNDRKDEAKEAIDLAFEYNPEAVGPLLYKAREALLNKDFETAEHYAEKVNVTDETEAIYLRAEILIQKGDLDKAETLLKEYTNSLPEEEQKEFVEGVLDIYIECRQFATALKWLKWYTKDNAEVLKEFTARALFGVGDYMKSEVLFQELLDKDPYSADYWSALSEIQFLKEDYAEALTSVNYALAINPNDKISLLYKGTILEAMENYDEAIKFFKKFSEKSPNNEGCYMHQAICYINMGENKKGLKLLEKAVSISDADSVCLPDIYREMALVYNTLGKLDKALWCIDMTEKLDCDHEYFDIIKGHILLANHKDKEAESLFEKVLKKSGNNPEMKLKIIISYQDNKHLTYAYNAFLDYFKEGAYQNEGYSYMAICCNDLMKNDEFLYYLKKACDCNPNEAKSVLGGYFPADMDPKDYYEYALKHSND